MTLSAQLRGKTALVTGGSSGLGRHFALTLARSGARVLVASRRSEMLEELVKEIKATGGSARAIQLDVSDVASIERSVGSAGAFDILVNNAGVTDTRSVLEYDEAAYDWVLNTNLKGSFFVAITAARTMKASGRNGSIINIASILGLRQGRLTSAYCISKAGVIQMTKQLALELARDGIRVNAIAPGYFETDINRQFFSTAAGQGVVKRVPMGHIGSFPDLDGPLLLLASDASRFMTGAVLAVDGGHLLSSL